MNANHQNSMLALCLPGSSSIYLTAVIIVNCGVSLSTPWNLSPLPPPTISPYRFKKPSILALIHSPFKFWAKSKGLNKTFSFLRMTAWKWRHLNLPWAMREETVQQDCKWRKIGKRSKASCLFSVGKLSRTTCEAAALFLDRLCISLAKNGGF